MSLATPLAAALDDLLPQTQCGQCGYKGCLPYAEAMAAGAADINRCPPGGDAVIADLAQRLQRTPMPLNTTCGITKPPAVALIDEAWCIGCTLCIQACPVDAIVGAAKVMHTVIADDCTGCELCITPCPVDCIEMVAITRPSAREAQRTRAAQARSLYVAREKRLARAQTGKKSTPAAPQTPLTKHEQANAEAHNNVQDDRKQAAVARAMARAATRVAERVGERARKE